MTMLFMVSADHGREAARTQVPNVTSRATPAAATYWRCSVRALIVGFPAGRGRRPVRATGKRQAEPAPGVNRLSVRRPAYGTRGTRSSAAAALRRQHPGGDADRGVVRRHVLEHDGVRADLRALADGEVAEHLRA